jgi:hypothetical protein
MALTYNDILDTYQNYPVPIRPFLLRAETHPTLRSQLTKSFMRVCIDVLSRAPIADPCRTLWLRNDIVADNLGISTKTVSRALNFMKKQAWLKSPPSDDGRNNWGQFGHNKFILGDELRAMLGLPTAPIITIDALIDQAASQEESKIIPLQVDDLPLETILITPIDETLALPDSHHPSPSMGKEKHEKHEENEENLPAETEMSHGVYTVNKVFLKEASEEEASNKKTEPQKQNDRATHVPDALTPLQTELGIHPFGIFKLMNLAKTMHQRLQDVWQAKRDQLRASGATGGRAFHYLKYLLETGEDFAYRAQTASIKSAHVKNKPDRDLRRYWNKRFVGENGLKVCIHGDGSAAVTNSGSAQPNAYVRPADVAPIYEAIAAGKLWLLDE